MSKSKFGMGLVLALVLSVPLAICWFGCGSTTPTYTELPTLETAITSTLNLTNGTLIDAAPPAGNDDTTFPAITSITGTTSLLPGDPITITLTTNYPSLYQITGAVIYLENSDGMSAASYIKITQGVESDGTMMITGFLADTISVFSDTMFNFKIALITDDNYTTSFGKYFTYTVTVKSTYGNSDGGGYCKSRADYCRCYSVSVCEIYVEETHLFKTCWTINNEFMKFICDLNQLNKLCEC